jgi:hypothetical protein
MNIKQGGKVDSPYPGYGEGTKDTGIHSFAVELDCWFNMLL